MVCKFSPRDEIPEAPGPEPSEAAREFASVLPAAF